MRYLLLSLFLMGCANMPNRYGDYVEITSGDYQGNRGRLMSDCPGFENYKVRLNDDRIVCAHSWQMEKIW